MSAQNQTLSPYDLHRPARLTAPLLFSSPHSGRNYPDDLLKRTILDTDRLRSSEDAFVHDLLAPVSEHGAILLSARYPRAYVDLNRAVDELDPALIEGVQAPARGARVMAGLGVIPRVVSGGRPIYRGKMSHAEAVGRLTAIWHPYHATLAALIGEVNRTFGHAVVFDVHSMPSDAVSNLTTPRPDIVLGDRFGTSARADTTAYLHEVFAGLGLRVARNVPFAGAYITQRYGRPAHGVEVVQIEINRALYMDEQAICPAPGYDGFSSLMAEAVGKLIAHWAEPGRLAAE